ncbi:hypothetical protein V6N11_076826 [Hibiscus sabdariffa]|uniref:Uncharacterized protein n=1 Tax=Hibiscus sabdariffa TaxID=183260 RepID=A0ABR2TBD8_9ROSI
MPTALARSRFELLALNLGKIKIPTAPARCRFELLVLNLGNVPEKVQIPTTPARCRFELLALSLGKHARKRCAITRIEKEEMLQYSRKDDEQRGAAALVH